MADEKFPLAGYVLLFTLIPVGFIFVHLVLGKLIRPLRPHAEKGTVYECGEPTIGSAWVQFDLRYYVVALLFVIFDVEVAFFFPWAVVYGQLNQVARVQQVPTTAEERQAINDTAQRQREWRERENKRSKSEQGKEEAPRPYRLPKAEPGQPPLEGEKKRAEYIEAVRAVTPPGRGQSDQAVGSEALETDRLTDLRVQRTAESATTFSLVALVDILVFFGVLLLGFAYVWKRGDLAWVKSTASEPAPPPPPPPAPPAPAPRKLAASAAH